MSTEVTTPEPNVRRPWVVGLAALVVFGLLAAGISYYGIQDEPGPLASLKKAEEVGAGFITRIALPTDDTPIPDGPHRTEFRGACQVCHSARLVFTQPLLTEKQWTAVVHKMAAKYGAPLSAEDEKQIVQYLHTVHGK
jgi:hypothetical protein